LQRAELVRKSIDIITENQDSGGAYVASPGFREYRFSWLRDGSFIGHAMLLWEREGSTRAFLQWAARGIE